MRHRIRWIVPLFLLVVNASCGGDAVMNPELPNGSVSAVVDGEEWTATISVTGNHANSIFAVGASGDGITIGMAIPTAMGPATHVIGPSNPANALLTEGSTTWAANTAMGSGTLVLTSLTDTNAKGTFTFTGQASGASPATRHVTQGTFDIDF